MRFLLALLCLPFLAQAQQPAWKLVWQDEFNQDGPPNPANWGYQNGFVRNQEAQWYQPQNAVCSNGCLVIEARREHLPNPKYLPGSYDWRTNRQWIDYTSACLLTRGKHDFTYGKIEVRARIDTRPGSWPAFWTLGVDHDSLGWPACGEVDAMEYYHGNLLANVAYRRNGRQDWSTHWKPVSAMGGDAWSHQFHTWTMIWDPHRIDLLVDGVLMNHFDVDSADQPGLINPFRQPHYILLNQAIGGKSGGDPSQTQFPVRMEVDWIRVYQDPSLATAQKS